MIDGVGPAEAGHRSARARPGSSGQMVIYLFVTAVLVLLAWQTTAVLWRESHPWVAALVGILTLCIIALFWANGRTGGRQRWWPGYVAAQSALVVALFLLTRVVAPVDISLAESTLLCLAGEALGCWGNTRRGFVLAGSYLTAALVSFVSVTPTSRLAAPLNQFGLIAATVIVLVVLVNRADAERVRSEALAEELRVSNSQVEELTRRGERQRMARELHDTLAQGLTGITLQLEAARDHLERDNPTRALSIVEQALVAARGTLASSREAIDDLRRNPDDLASEMGRRAARFTRDTGVRASVEVTGEGELSPEAREHLLRVLDEALANAARHSGASQVRIEFHDGDGSLSLQVTDDGSGFEPDEVAEGHYGLVGMRERAALLGGTLEIASRPGHTAVRLEVAR